MRHSYQMDSQNFSQNQTDGQDLSQHQVVSQLEYDFNKQEMNASRNNDMNPAMMMKQKNNSYEKSNENNSFIMPKMPMTGKTNTTEKHRENQQTSPMPNSNYFSNTT